MHNLEVRKVPAEKLNPAAYTAGSTGSGFCVRFKTANSPIYGKSTDRQNPRITRPQNQSHSSPER